MTERGREAGTVTNDEATFDEAAHGRLFDRLQAAISAEAHTDEERINALLNMIAHTVAVIHCSDCRRVRINGLKKAFPAMLRSIPALAAELHDDSDEAPAHLH